MCEGSNFSTFLATLWEIVFQSYLLVTGCINLLGLQHTYFEGGQNSVHNQHLFGFFISSWVTFGSLCISRNLSIHLSYLIYWCILFMLFSYTPFNFHKVGNKVPTWISDFSYLCLLSFFFVSLPTCLSILLIFSKNPLLVSWILLFFCPLFHWHLGGG